MAIGVAHSHTEEEQQQCSLKVKQDVRNHRRKQGSQDKGKLGDYAKECVGYQQHHKCEGCHWNRNQHHRWCS